MAGGEKCLPTKGGWITTHVHISAWDKAKGLWILHITNIVSRVDYVVCLLCFLPWLFLRVYMCPTPTYRLWSLLDRVQEGLPRVLSRGNSLSAPGSVQASVRRLVRCTLPLYSFLSEDVMLVDSNKVVFTGASDSP